MPPRRRCFAVIVGISLAFASGCAAKKPRAPVAEPFPPADFARAEALVTAGCYDCLRDALDIYEAIRVRHPTETLVSDRVLTTSLVLAIRERELGMVDHGYGDRARGVAGLASGPAQAGTLVEIVDTIPWPQTARARDEGGLSLERVRAAGERRAAWRQTLAALMHPLYPAVRYIASAFDCAWPQRDAPPELQLALGDVEEPLLVFAKNVCRGTSADPFVALLQRDPRFVEAEYYIGLRALGARKLEEADARLTRALEWRPEWPALSTTLAGVAMTAEDPARALALYDRTLAMVPRQQDARLGRLTALSYLGRFEEAIVVANGLVEEGRWFVGDSLYWRAWNKTQVGRIEEAWADVQRARALLVDDKTPKLAGIIAVKRHQYEEGQALFEEARARNPGDCETKFYLAAVHAHLRHWPPSAEIFAEATACYRDEAAGLRAEIARMESSDAAPERKQRIIEKRAKQLAVAIAEGETSCYNAAVGYMNSGKKDEARTYADQAAQAEQYKEKAGELLARIGKMK